MIVQKLKKTIEGDSQLAERYCELISALNGLFLTKREIELLAYAAITGNIAPKIVRWEFCKERGTSMPTVSNMMSKLKKMGLIVKDNKAIRIHPALSLDFKKDVVLQISLLHGQASNVVS